MRRRTTVALLVAVGLVVGVGWPAAAADSQGGLWWYSRMGVAEVQAAGVTGAGVRVAVIDGQINTQVAQLAGANVQVREPSYCLTAEGSSQWAPADTTAVSSDSLHGTNVVSMISGTGKGVDGAPGVAGVAPGATVRFYAIGDGTDAPDSEKRSCPVVAAKATAGPIDRAVVQAVDDGAKIISLSVDNGGGPAWLSAVAWALHQGVIMVIAMPNHADGSSGRQLTNGTVRVGAEGPDLQPPSWEATTWAPTVRAPGDQMLMFYPSFDQTVTYGSGTSLAAPLVAGVLADVWSKYPTATGNQILQSLVLNTGGVGADHALGYDTTFGYGLVGLRHMLAHDPTQYPDVNPVLSADGSGYGDLTAAQVKDATRPDWAPAVASSSTPPVVTSSPPGSGVVPGASHGPGLWVWIGAGVAALVVAAVVVTAILVTRRPPRGAPGQ